MWWGGWLLFNYPNQFAFDDFLVSNFALLFSLFGLGAAFQDMSDRKETEKSASRIFYLLDRKSTIDPLSSDGKILNISDSAKKKKKRKSSVKRKKSFKPLEQTIAAANEKNGSSEVSTKMKRSSSVKVSKKIDEEAAIESPKSAKKKKSLKKSAKTKKSDHDIVDE
jgi:hypothetical protein